VLVIFFEIQLLSFGQHMQKARNSLPDLMLVSNYNSQGSFGQGKSGNFE